jgi:hypothetical protein
MLQKNSECNHKLDYGHVTTEGNKAGNICHRMKALIGDMCLLEDYVLSGYRSLKTIQGLDKFCDQASCHGGSRMLNL